MLCVAGFIAEKDACVQMDADWAAALEKFDLPYFRMSACAHGTEPFDHLSMDQRIQVEKEMIAIIKRSISYGIAITVEPEKYEAIMPEHPELGTAYSFCAHSCLVAVRGWADENSYQGKVAYFFESGHPSQPEANEIMNDIFRNPDLNKSYRYVSHAFADKREVRPLQAADMIAWQWFTDHKRRTVGKALRPRLDCMELMLSDDGSSKYHMLHYDEVMLRAMAGKILRGRYPLTYPV